jgi:hypothetical protein
MQPDVERLIRDCGPLVAVSGRDHGATGRFWALAFHFPEGVLHLRCDHDTDEVIAEVKDAGSLAYAHVKVGTLAALIGMDVEYAWELTNQRGYTDGFQLRFIDDERREETRQFEGAASTLGVLVVAETPR